MELLHAWALGAAALLAVPLLVHLRRRSRTRRVPFPALRYLDRALEARSRSFRTSHLLLLAVRMLLLLALAGAAAGPLLGRGGPEDHHPTDLALVIDNTASVQRLSGERPLLEALRAGADAVLDAAGPRDRVWVVPVVGPPLATGAPPHEARDALARLVPTDGSGDPVAVARAAAALLPPPREGRAREVHLASDLQARSIESGARVGPSLPPLVARRPDPEPARGVNEAVVGLQSPARVGPGEPGAVTVAVARWGGPPGEGVRVRLRLEVDGATAAAAEAAPGETVVLRLPTGLPPGTHRGRVEIEPSGLRADDARDFVFHVGPPPAVRLDAPEESFLRVALETLESAGRIRMAGPTDARALRVVEGAEGVRAAAGGRGAGARASGSGGGGSETLLLVPPLDPVDLPAFNAFLERHRVPWRLETVRASGELGLEGPVVRRLPALEPVRVSRRYRLAAVGAGAAATRVRMRTSDGEPWLLRGPERDGAPAYLLLASPLEPDATDLPTSAAMVPWVGSLLAREAAPERILPAPIPAGEPFILPARARSVVRPDGSTSAVEGGASFRPLRAGVHVVRLGPADDGAPDSLLFAAGVPPAESDPETIDPAALPELWPGGEVVMAGPEPRGWRSAAYRARRGADAAPWLLAAALLLVAVEAVLAAPRRTQRTPAPPTTRRAGLRRTSEST